MVKSPCFQWYPKDYLSSIDCRRMSYEEKGVYRELLDISWEADPQCFLPNDPSEIAEILEISPKKFQKLWEKISKKFSTTEDGKYLFNERLLRELRKQHAKRLHLSENGKLGGRPRKEPELDQKAIEKQKVFTEKAIDNQKKSLAIASAFASASANTIPTPPVLKSEEKKESLVVLLQNGSTWAVPEADLTKWSTEYKDLNIPHEIRKAYDWCQDCAESRKSKLPKSNGRVFLRNWLDNARKFKQQRQPEHSVQPVNRELDYDLRAHFQRERNKCQQTH